MAEPALPPRPRPGWPLGISVVAALCGLAAHDLELSFEALLYGFDDMAEYFGRYTAPDFSELPRFAGLMAQTLATALWGTLLSLLIAVPLAPLAARTLTPHPLAYHAVRGVLDGIRAMPDLLLALVFVAALGLGPLPGVLALGVHTAGFLGKFTAEAMERVEPGVIEALAATGAGRAAQVMYAAWPSVLREVAGYALFILDRNVRMASVLGLVGAGGIGLALHDTLRLFDYGRSAALILVLLVTIVAIDTASSWLRERLR